MVERSYRINNHLKSTLLANLSNVHRLTGNKELCLQYTDQMLPLLNDVKKLSAVDLTEINPAADQESLDLFWNSLSVFHEEAQMGKTDKSHSSVKYYYTTEAFTSVRKVQFVSFAGHCLGTCRLHEEGLIYINKAFEMILTSSRNSEDPKEMFLKQSFALTTALSKLADLSDNSMRLRGKGLSAKHIKHDCVSLLFNLPHFKISFPSISDLDLSLTSSFRDIKNAAVQIYKSRHSSSDAHKVSDSQLSEYEMMSLTGTGIVGIALLDIEHHCTPLPENVSDEFQNGQP